MATANLSNESVYALIPPDPVPFEKAPLYKSKHPKELITVPKKPAAMMGVPTAKPDPKTFLAKGEKTYSKTHLPEPQNFKRPEDTKRAAVPKKEDKPIMGLKSEKNFIVANAVENILMAPAKVQKQAPSEKHAEYGQVPKYLNQIKDRIVSEYRYIEEMERARQTEGLPRMRVLGAEEKEELLTGLKTKWEETNRRYQTISFTLDTPSKKKRKEDLEAELEQLEKDIRLLAKEVVVVHDD
eukprot:CAMPEP_0184661662 /NCGR_PEP_ID=MMETSP0308-20130426/39501_1 /TAXON_ID=38269 /ORGANISM="Gloeochaete witrockiana, Strain SAG 46.84" /LENGTH=239 /DNA_ID=CAMNT_0027103119 /DNA_START=89 /DNA_END=808 /DNA_ORIENTATION=-